MFRWIVRGRLREGSSRVQQLPCKTHTVFFFEILRIHFSLFYFIAVSNGKERRSAKANSVTTPRNQPLKVRIFDTEIFCHQDLSVNVSCVMYTRRKKSKGSHVDLIWRHNAWNRSGTLHSTMVAFFILLVYRWVPHLRWGSMFPFTF